MNENILDDTLIDDLRWSLEPDERIIWEGKPSIKSLLSNPFKDTKNVFEDIFVFTSILFSGFVGLSIDGGFRLQPTIEFIDNVRKVGKIIRKGIRGKL